MHTRLPSPLLGLLSIRCCGRAGVFNQSPTGGHRFFSASCSSVSPHSPAVSSGLIPGGEISGSKGLRVFEAPPSRKVTQAADHSWGGGERGYSEEWPSLGQGWAPFSFSDFLLLSRAEPMRTTIFQYPIGWPPVQELPPSLRAPPPGGWPLQPSVQWG